MANSRRAADSVAPAAVTAATGPGGRVQVKFVDGSGIRLRGGELVSLAGADLSGLHDVLLRYPGTAIDRLFTRPEDELAAEKARIEATTGTPQPDLNLYYLLTIPAGADAAIADLRRLGVVENVDVDHGAAPPPAP